MRLISWLTVGATAAYLVYRKMLEKEAQTQPEPTRLLAAQRSGPAEESIRETKSSGAPRTKPVAGKTLPLEKRIVKQVVAQPGLLQTELYGLFPAIGRKQLQVLLLRLGRQGVLRRTPEKGTYRLFPAN